jgi:1-deoxy-D-xylulose-5-phosphate reductoisomerase
MRLPIQYALTYPERVSSPGLHLDLGQIGRLEFFPADTEQFPALALARAAGEAGSTYPTVLSGADEVAVERFLAGEIQFTEITSLVAEIIERHQPEPGPLTLDAVAAADRWARQQARRLARAGI